MMDLNSEFFRTILDNPESDEVRDTAGALYNLFAEEEEKRPFPPDERQVKNAGRALKLMFSILAGRIHNDDAEQILDFADYLIDKTERFRRSYSDCED